MDLKEENDNFEKNHVNSLIRKWCKNVKKLTGKKEMIAKAIHIWKTEYESQMTKEDFEEISRMAIDEEEEEEDNSNNETSFFKIGLNLASETTEWNDFVNSELLHLDQDKRELLLHLRNGDQKVFKNNQIQRTEPRFFFGLCPESLTIEGATTPLKTCSGCYCLSYATKEAQKKDWKNHKLFCKSLQPFVSSKPGHHPLSGQPDFHAKIQLVLAQTLNRSLSQFESDLLVYPRLCAVCLTGNQNDLKNCPKCHCVAYCSEAHLEEDKLDHGKSCHLLRICIEDYVQEKRHGRRITDLFVPRPTFSLKQGVDRPYVKLPDKIEDVFSNELSIFWIKNLSSNQTNDLSELRRLTFKYTCPLTVFYGAEQAGLAKGTIDTYESLVIHLVGARQAECRDVTIWEIFPLRLPKLKQLTVVFIGPEISCGYAGETDFVCMSPALLKLRPDAGIRYQYVNLPYDEFMNGKSNTIRPDIVAALNCGFVFYKEWDKSLPYMVKYADVPLIFTEYYSEDCNLDLQKLDSLVDDELEVVTHPSTPNPFCSSLPARIPTGFAFRRFKRRSVVMSNDFICVVKAASA